MERLQYVGKIPQLQGKTVLIRPLTDQDRRGWLVELTPKHLYVMAQFDDYIIFHDRNMGLNWHPFLKSDFQPVGPKPIF